MRFLMFALAAAWTASAMAAVPVVTLSNNHPFSIRAPLRVPCDSMAGSTWVTSQGHPVQQTGSDIIFIADGRASTNETISFLPGSGLKPGPLKVKPSTRGIEASYDSNDLGRFSWDIDFHAVPGVVGETNEPSDFATSFNPLELGFHQTVSGPVFAQWEGGAIQNGLALRVTVIAYSAGFIDIRGSLTNESADASVKSYAAVICRWEQPPASSQTLGYDNHILDLGVNNLSPDRSWREGSQTYKQHGADWLLTAFKNGGGAGWLNDFSPSFTIVDNTTRNSFHAPRWALANLSQLGQEFQTTPSALYSITEIARSDTRAFHDRPTENRIPLRGEGVSFGSRLVFDAAEMAANAVDHAFVAYTSYNSHSGGAANPAFSFGVPFIRFGTSYFPYSTLGENFDDLKLPGMESESFWPLAADTVLQWPLFADDIRRDLSIAKAMGFQLIRLHHLELLGAIPEKKRIEYLDFLFGELRRLRLRALVDINASPERLAELVGRYRDVIDGVELENEILIWGIPLDRPPQWKAEYEAVKKAAPNIPVNLTGYNNTGMFNRLIDLGVPFDRVDLHSYIDSVDAIPSGRGYALALGSFGSKLDKPTMISEWNWRGLTKMSEEDRARIYAPIMEDALATRAIGDFYQFQFNETLAPNPRTGRGRLLRHYELLNLSRRPKPEALEFMKLIEKYSAPNDPVRILRGPHEVFTWDGTGPLKINIPVTQISEKPLRLHVSLEYSGLRADLQMTTLLTLSPGQTAQIPITLTMTNRQPGFYHVFVRLESDEGFLRYLWAEVRVPGAPRTDGGGTNFDFTRPAIVAYGPKASSLDVETAFAIGETLESATGRVVPIEPLEDVPGASAAHVIFVGADRETPSSAGADWLRIGGKSSRGVEQAGMDFILHYWKFAKDSAARRVGLARKDLPRGGDPAKLP